MAKFIPPKLTEPYKKPDGSWWFGGGVKSDPEYGPYRTKQEAHEDRVGLQKFRNAHPEIYCAEDFQ